MPHMISFKEWFKKMTEGDAIVSSCRPTADYQVAGACSDLKPRKKRRKK